ncbi:MAG: hypothetical protein ACREQ5_24045, partial [Candidatus Dormibacteria bacterium]
MLALAAAFGPLRPAARSSGALRDFEATEAAGRAFALGANPYGPALVRSERVVSAAAHKPGGLLPFVGPPYGLPLWRALAASGPRFAPLVWRCVLALAFVALALAALRLCGPTREPLAAV